MGVMIVSVVINVTLLAITVQEVVVIIALNVLLNFISILVIYALLVNILV